MYQNDDGYYAMQVASYYFLHRKKNKILYLQIKDLIVGI